MLNCAANHSTATPEDACRISLAGIDWPHFEGLGLGARISKWQNGNTWVLAAHCGQHKAGWNLWSFASRHTR
jgi:hypothetical protein